MNLPALDSMLHWLLRTSLEATVLIIVVLALRSLLGNRLSPGWRMGLWLLVGLKLLLPACIPAGFGLGSWIERTPLAPEAPVVIISHTSSPRIAAVEALPMLENSASITGLQVAALLWLLGAVSFFGLAMHRQRRFEKGLLTRPVSEDGDLQAELKRLQKLIGLEKQVRILLMPAGSTPAVIGMRQPRLLLPEDWRTRFDAISLRHVLLHELLHVRHRDLLWNWVTLGVQALHWFNPLVWIIGSQFQADRELRCDESLLRLLSPNERLAYGHTLLRIQETFFVPPAIAGLAPCVRNHPALHQRITMIAQPNRHRPWFQALFIAAFGLMACYAFTTAVADEKDSPAKDRNGEGQRRTAVKEHIKSQENQLNKLISKLLPAGVTVTKSTVNEARFDIDGHATSMEAVLQLKDLLSLSPELSDWIWEVPVPIQKSGKFQFRFTAIHPQELAEKDQVTDGIRDGDRAKEPGMSDREGTPRTGPRDGEGERKGPRDGDAKKSGMKDGDRPKIGERDGDRPREKPEAKREAFSGEIISLQVTGKGETVVIGKDEVPMNRLRGFLQTFLPEHPGAQVMISGEAEVSEKTMHQVMDAVRDNGNKNVRLATAKD